VGLLIYSGNYRDNPRLYWGIVQSKSIIQIEKNDRRNQTISLHKMKPDPANGNDGAKEYGRSKGYSYRLVLERVIPFF
jgi:hypothetical protein